MSEHISRWEKRVMVQHLQKAKLEYLKKSKGINMMGIYKHRTEHN